MSRLQDIQSYACYYGRGQLDQLQRFPLVILQPESHSPDEIESLRAHGTLTLGYLSLGESAVQVEGASWYLRNNKGDLLHNSDWNTCYIDTRNLAWQKHLLTAYIPTILADRGFDGLFLDTLDSQDRYPEIRGGSIALVHAIRAAYPSTILLINRGFTILDSIIADLDGIVFECFSTYFQSGHYSTWDTPYSDYNARLAERLNYLHGAFSLKLFALDYAPPNDVERIEYAVRRARAYGFIPYVSTAHLDQLYFPHSA